MVHGLVSHGSHFFSGPWQVEALLGLDKHVANVVKAFRMCLGADQSDFLLCRDRDCDEGENETAAP